MKEWFVLMLVLGFELFVVLYLNPSLHLVESVNFTANESVINESVYNESFNLTLGVDVGNQTDLEYDVSMVSIVPLEPVFLCKRSVGSSYRCNKDGEAIPELHKVR